MNYYEKDTGLLIKTTMNSIIIEREYEFKNIGDEIFIEPDIGQYKI